jgi:hypothetical protein
MFKLKKTSILPNATEISGFYRGSLRLSAYLSGSRCPSTYCTIVCSSHLKLVLKESMKSTNKLVRSEKVLEYGDTPNHDVEASELWIRHILCLRCNDEIFPGLPLGFLHLTQLFKLLENVTNYAKKNRKENIKYLACCFVNVFPENPVLSGCNVRVGFLVLLRIQVAIINESNRGREGNTSRHTAHSNPFQWKAPCRHL